MPPLMMYVAENQKFELGRLVEIFREAPNWSELKSGTGIAIYECTYCIEEDCTVFRVHGNLMAIAIDRASLSSF